MYLDDRSAPARRPSNTSAQSRRFSSRWWRATSIRRLRSIAAQCCANVHATRRWRRSCCTRKSSSTSSNTSKCQHLILHQMHFPHSRFVQQVFNFSCFLINATAFSRSFLPATSCCAPSSWKPITTKSLPTINACWTRRITSRVVRVWNCWASCCWIVTTSR